MKRLQGPLLAALLAVALAMLGAPAPAAAETLAQEEAEGGRIFQDLQSGERSCGDLSESDFERIGEYVMGSMMGGAHAAMNRSLKARLGERGEEQVHIAMGKRWSGCDPNARFPRGAGGMMGGGMMGGAGYGGMMGQGGGPGGAGPGGGGMMGPGGSGFAFRAQTDSDDWSAAAVLMLVGMGLLLILVLAGVFLLARGRAPGGRPALAVLQERYARGEISDEEFRRARDALAG